MKFAHKIELIAFCYPDEDFQDIYKSFLGLLPFCLGDEKIRIEKNTAIGFNNKEIIILKCALEKTYHTNSFLKNILNNLTHEEKSKILEQLETKLDDKLKFFLRFDKEKWINDKKLILTDSGKCFHIKISIAAFPSKRENALEVARNLFFLN